MYKDHMIWKRHQPIEFMVHLTQIMYNKKNVWCVNMNYKIISEIINSFYYMKAKIHSHSIWPLIRVTLCNHRTKGLIGSGSMYWETLRVDEEDARRIYGILTKCTCKIQNIIQNYKIYIKYDYITNNNKYNINNWVSCYICCLCSQVFCYAMSNWICHIYIGKCPSYIHVIM
jgi:hypothetical protein